MSQLLPLTLLEELAQELRAELAVQAAQAAAEWERMQFVSIDIHDDRAGATVQRVRADAFEKVRSATRDRTQAVYGQAFRLAHYLAYWPLSEQDLIRDMLDAARANGSAAKYGEDDILRQIHNGIREGMANPTPLAIPTRDKHGRPLPPDESHFADLLPDATAAWNDLPSVANAQIEQGQTVDIINSSTVTDNSQLHTLNQATDWLYAVALAQTFAPKYTAAIIYTLARMALGRTVGFTDRVFSTLAGIEESAARYGLDLSYKVLYKYIGNEWVEDFFLLFSIEKDIPPMEKSGNNSGRPAEIFIELKPVDELISILERRRDDAIGLIAAEFDGKALPMRPQANYLERIEGITTDNAQAALEAWQIATNRAREGTPEFADDYRLFTGRAGELQRAFALLRDRADDLAVFEIAPKRRGKGSAHNVLAAELYDYYYTLLGEDKDHPIWLDCALVGVTAPTLRNKIKPLAGLRYKGDTHEYVIIEADTPENVARKVAAAGKSLRGRPLAIRSDSSEWRPCKTENYAGVIDCAVKDGGALTLRVSVSRPLERYTPVPAEITQAKAAKRSNTVSGRPKEEQPERKPHVRKRDRNIIRESIMRLPLAAGWQYDKDLALWRDPGRLLWPDDPVTILQALSDRPIAGALDPLGKAPVSEDTTMLTMHYQAEKYEPEESLPVSENIHTTSSSREEEVIPAPVFQTLENTQPADWWPNFQAVMYPRQRVRSYAS